MKHVSISTILVGGARPNFVKLAPVYRALNRSSKFSVSLVHTGQHYSEDLSDIFFEELRIPRPDIYLGAGSGSHGEQTAILLKRFEEVLLERKPHLVIVVGDVNSSLACALAAAKVVYGDGRRPKIAHVEAGLRSFDRTMPEEVNRVLTDTISDFLFTTEQSANANLMREGIPAERIFFVGNVMIDTLLNQIQKATKLRVWESYGYKERGYGVVTLHRPSSVDDRETLNNILHALEKVSETIPLVFPIHPRTAQRLQDFGLQPSHGAGRCLKITLPLGYLEFLSLLSQASLVLTDSGGIQEETTVLGVPCLTLRENTERPITLEEGTNTLVGVQPQKILQGVDQILSAELRCAERPKLWDGKAAERIVRVLEDHC